MSSSHYKEGSLWLQTWKWTNTLVCRWYCESWWRVCSSKWAWSVYPSFIVSELGYREDK